MGTAGSAGCNPVGCTAIAPGVANSAVDATAVANQIFTSGFPQGLFSCASPQANPASCLPPVAITAIPDGKLHAPYFMEWSLGMEHQFGTAASLQAQYVGTRAVNQPYSTQVNGYQTVCQGCFAPFPCSPLIHGLAQSRSSRPVRTVTTTVFNSRLSNASPTVCKDRSITLSAVAWIPSRTADSCNSPQEEFFRLCRENSPATTVPATTTSGTI